MGSYSSSLKVIYFLIFLWNPIWISADQGQDTSLGFSLLKAIQITLSKNPNIRLQQEETKFSKGALQIQMGAFDMVFRSSVEHQKDHASAISSTETTGFLRQTTDLTTQSVALQKRLRSGIVMGPQAQLFQSNVNDDGVNPENQGRVDFVIQVPLLKGRGKEATGAEEKAAQKEYEASLLLLRHTVSQSVLNTVLAYWNYQAARHSLDILLESEQRARSLVEQISKIIEADERPKSDLDQLLANLSDKATSRLNAEQTYYEARQNLGLAIGIAFNEIELLLMPLDEFPTTAQASQENWDVGSWTQQAAKKRADLIASKLKEESSKIVLISAKNGMLPQTDFRLRAGYAGLDEGPGIDPFYRALGDDISGLNVTASLNYEWPFSNHTAKGQHLQVQANYEKSLIQTENLSRTISTQVAIALFALKQSIAELAESQKAVELYQKAVESEKEKFHLGMSTLIDVIDIDDRLLNAKSNHVLIQQRYANALVQLRFQTGTLIDFKGEEHSVDISRIMEVEEIR